MMPDWIDTNAPWFIVTWQTTFWLALGMGVSMMLRSRPARGHAVLVLCIAASILTPPATLLFRSWGWGFLSPLLGAGVSDAGPPLAAALIPQPAGLWGLIPSLLFVVWGALTMIMVIRLALALRGARSLIRRARPVDRPSLTAAARLATRRLSLSRPLQTLCSPDVSCPIVWGWGPSARILIPESFLERSDRNLWSVLCHELAHVKRRDHVSALLVEIATCLLAWHPLMWIARRQTETLSEHACDAWVLSSGASATAYADTLLSFVPYGGSVVALAAVRRRTGLARRVERILDDAPHRPAAGIGFTIATMLLVVGLLGTTTLAQRRTHIEPNPDAATGVMSPAQLAALGVMEHFKGVVALPGELDLGLADAGEVKAGRVWLVNAGNRPLTITDTKTSCGCTTVEDLAGTVVAPGTWRAVNVTIAADTAPGVRKTKHVTFLVEGQTPLKIPLHVTVRGPAP